MLARGDTLVGFLKVLRDDLPADPDGRVAGIGYSVLVWSHDGTIWHRDREPYFDRNPEPGSWDHAMAWIDCPLPVGDEVYLYYGGYARGHKVEPATERQVGLVKVPRDRYVAWETGPAGGTLRTTPVVLAGKTLSLNLDTHTGEARVQLVDEQGHPLPGRSFADCVPIKVDGLEAPVRWNGVPGELGRRPVRVEIRLRQARLFALNVAE